jgi:hypothetical protein
MQSQPAMSVTIRFIVTPKGEITLLRNLTFEKSPFEMQDPLP